MILCRDLNGEESGIERVVFYYGCFTGKVSPFARDAKVASVLATIAVDAAKMIVSLYRTYSIRLKIKLMPIV